MTLGSKLRDRRKPAVGRESVSRRLGLSGARVLKAALALGSVAILAAAYGLSPDLRESVNEIAGSLARRDLEAARRYVLSFGAWAPLVSLALMVLQAIVAPIPAFALNVVNGLVFGALWGFVLSLAGRALAASVCFGLARALGQDAVEALVGERGSNAATGGSRSGAPGRCS